MIQRIHLLKLVENYLSAYFTFHQLRGKEVAESSRKKKFSRSTAPSHFPNQNSSYKFTWSFALSLPSLLFTVLERERAGTAASIPMIPSSSQPPITRTYTGSLELELLLWLPFSKKRKVQIRVWSPVLDRYVHTNLNFPGLPVTTASSWRVSIKTQPFSIYVKCCMIESSIQSRWLEKVIGQHKSEIATLE